MAVDLCDDLVLVFAIVDPLDPLDLFEDDPFLDEEPPDFRLEALEAADLVFDAIFFNPAAILPLFILARNAVFAAPFSLAKRNVTHSWKFFK